MIIILLLLLLLSAFFSSLETALFNLKSHDNINETVRKLLSKPKKLLSTLLTGNTIVNIAIGSIAATYTITSLSKYSDLSDSTLLFVGKFTPEILAN